MAYAQTTQTAGFNLAEKFNAFTANWKLNRARRAVYAATFNELNALSDRELVDIGLGRAEIGSIAWEHAEKSV